MEDLKPGRELDALIADRVMGFRESLLGARTQFEYETIRRKIGLCPEYSTDIAAAWAVVDRVWGVEWFRVEKTMSIKDEWVWGAGNIEAICGELLIEEDVIGVSAPHAICLAALKAVVK